MWVAPDTYVDPFDILKAFYPIPEVISDIDKMSKHDLCILCLKIIRKKHYQVPLLWEDMRKLIYVVAEKIHSLSLDQLSDHII
jgi:hypothetical protein